MSGRGNEPKVAVRNEALQTESDLPVEPAVLFAPDDSYARAQRRQKDLDRSNVLLGPLFDFRKYAACPSSPRQGLR